MTENSPALNLRTGTQRTFLHLLLNTLVVSVMNFTVWFAVTFWVYLETRSVFATGLISGIFLVSIAATGIWFGSLVDHHHKKTVMQWSATVSLLLYAGCLTIYLTTPDVVFRDPGSLRLWVFVVLLMLGVVTGNLRTIAMPTLVTLLIPEDRRDKANGLVGTATGLSFLVTSVISGLLVAAGGMYYVLLLAIGVLGLSMLHLGLVRVPENRPVRLARGEVGAGVDLRGTTRLVRSVPGLVALIAFSCFNNFLGGSFMALMDAYGLSLVSVQFWGLLWGVLSAFVIVGGLVVARVGLGSNPVRTLLLVNLVLWTVTALFPVRSSIVLLAAGMAVFMLMMPFAEAAEQTVLQKVVPFERQGRVFGFAQSVEQAASPLTAFLMGPIAQFLVIPFMTDGWGADVLGPWFGTGAERGLALVFMVTGVVGILTTLLALRSRSYRRLSRSFAGPQDDGDAGRPGIVEKAVDGVA
jgi:DHA3 family multidrug efflux protein-like MFS transporter